MSAIVRHNTFGVGTVRSIDDWYIEISFGGNIKKFQFPKAFEKFLTTDDQVLLQRIEDAKKGVNSEAAKTSSTAALSQTTTKRKAHLSGMPFERTVNSKLLGPRSQTITVYSESEMFELVGYIAAPGRVSSFEAEVPKDGRDDTFERLFPGQRYRPIEIGDTPSGMPNKLSSQFRINFSNLRNCPVVLKKNMGKGNASCVGRVNKSKFVLDLVQNYGFQFGDRQDINRIRAIAKERGYLEAFIRGYNL